MNNHLRIGSFQKFRLSNSVEFIELLDVFIFIEQPKLVDPLKT
jgi:hypothetical protein